VGDALDFWRVLEIEKPFRLLLLAEMKTPGEALLEITLNPVGEDECELVLLSRFLPRGLFGMAYWYVLYPFHQYVFAHMLKGIAKASGAGMISRPQRFTPKITRSCPLPENIASCERKFHE
jgi:hypothetical protein